MDEQIEKKNKILEEDPDDFETKSSLFTDESKVFLLVALTGEFARLHKII